MNATPFLVCFCWLFSKASLPSPEQTYFLNEPNDQILVHVEALYPEVLDMVRFEL